MIELEEPDKGRAWVVAIASCIINLILSGISRCVSILYVSLIENYGVTRGEATLPFTIRNSVRCLSGPVVGIIGIRFGIRNVTFFGGVLAFAGVALCAVAPDVIWITVLWGGIHGLGFSFANTLFQVIVNQYFEKYRATASGIALSGACLGSLGFPVLVEWILDTFGLSGSFLILGGIIMHVLPPSLLLSSPQWVEHPEGYARLRALETASTETTLAKSDDSSESETESEQSQLERKAFQKKLARTISMSNNPVESSGVTVASKNMQTGLRSNHSKKITKMKRNTQGYKLKKRPASDSNVELENRRKSSTNADFSAFTIANQFQKETTNGAPNGPVPKDLSHRKGTPSVLELIQSMIHLYTIPVYILISLCMCTYVLIFITTQTVLVDYSMDKGIPESHGKYLLISMAIGDIIGRLCFGWVTDKKFMTLPTYMFFVLAFQGVFVAVFPVSSSFSAFVLLLVLYSMTAGNLIVIIPVLVIHYTEDCVQCVAIGNVGLLAGIISLGIPSMITHFRDNIGSYDGIFYLTGAISIFVGSLWLLLPLVSKSEVGNIAENTTLFDPEETVSNLKQNSSDENPQDFVKEKEDSVSEPKFMT
ncbi:hypothetical protein JTE90_022264 [Oedothorax gibbosus]|uniref:Uncharacterized protein n=1 Tax=Oedothorax gibbosus TaxID=931172 RepID=A0AAV6VXU5_9ARAC|nr:hypothetical protein JTE90_022264 [Oedothorax gibbosus]